MRSTRRALLLAAAVASGATAAAPAEAASTVLRDRATGLSVTVPAGAGWRLSRRGGVYTLRNRSTVIRFMRVRSPLSAKGTLAAYAKKRRLTVVATRLSGKARIVTYRTAAGSTVVARAKPVGRTLDLAAISAPGARKGRAPAAVTDPGLLRILDTRRGGRTFPLDIPIPMKTFRGQGVSAQVPALPGWVYRDEGKGWIDGGHPRQGGFFLGSLHIIGWQGGPDDTGQFPIVPYPDTRAATALVALFAFRNPTFRLDRIVEVPGTDGIFGAGHYSSGYFAMAFRIKGVQYQVLASAGTASYGADSFGEYLYSSAILVPTLGDGGIGAALLRTWQTWNPSGAQRQILAETLHTLLTTPSITGGPIDPDVFQAAADAWGDYIRS